MVEEKNERSGGHSEGAEGLDYGMLKGQPKIRLPDH
jgi:hypothetical protein